MLSILNISLETILTSPLFFIVWALLLFVPIYKMLKRKDCDLTLFFVFLFVELIVILIHTLAFFEPSSKGDVMAYAMGQALLFIYAFVFHFFFTIAMLIAVWLQVILKKKK